MKANNDIRIQIQRYRLRYWEVAEKIHITNSTFSNWLREPLKGQRRERVFKAIEELKKEVV